MASGGEGAGMDIKTNKKPGDTVYWVKDGIKQWRVYKATIEAISLCEYQGALYCELFCPEFKINPHPTVHYSFVFLTKARAEDFKKEARKMKDKEGIMPVCFGCNYAWSGRG